jgi:two-component system OmpR family response regulator
MDGLSVLQRWRQAGRSMPVLILTARDHWHDKVAGIDAGADDYLTKPFQMEELLARLRALIRRANGLASPVLQCGALELDTRSGRVTLAGQAVTLTSHEYKLLHYLMHRPGATVSRAELTEQLYAQDFERDSNTIEVFVGRLRKKLPSVPIETVRGLGYRLAA